MPQTAFGTDFGIATGVVLRVAASIGFRITFHTSLAVPSGFRLTIAVAAPLAFGPAISHEIAVQTPIRLAI